MEKVRRKEHIKVKMLVVVRQRVRMKVMVNFTMKLWISNDVVIYNTADDGEFDANSKADGERRRLEHRKI